MACKLHTLGLPPGTAGHGKAPMAVAGSRMPLAVAKPRVSVVAAVAGSCMPLAGAMSDCPKRQLWPRPEEPWPKRQLWPRLVGA